jgi:hypothetical protein
MLEFRVAGLEIGVVRGQNTPERSGTLPSTSCGYRCGRARLPAKGCWALHQGLPHLDRCAKIIMPTAEGQTLQAVGVHLGALR